MSEPTSNLATALARVQGELPRIAKDRTAQVRSDKGNYSYRYADLAGFAEAVMPVLSRHGLAWMTRPTLTDVGFVLEYALMHGESGEAVVGCYPLPDPTRVTAQQVGSAITYARRYALSCVVGAVADEDDDGHAASQAKPPAAAKAPAKRAPAASAAPALPPRRTDVDWYSHWQTAVRAALDEPTLDRLLDELHAQYEARALTVADKDAAKLLLAEKRGDLQAIAADWGGTPTQDGAA